MIVKCHDCGTEQSPADVCTRCGHPMMGTVVGDMKTVQPGTTALYQPGSQRDTAADDSVLVELLKRIAGQSHFEERYLLRGELARGGMGRVFRAYDQVLRRDVAVKMLGDATGEASLNPAYRGQFLKEARVGGRLLHPNVLAVFDVGVNRADQLYYTMRLVDGASLHHCLESVDKGVVTKLVSFPLRRIVEAFLGACHGVDYANQQGVLHLDLKPHNILVSGFREVFVIDWGLARVDDKDDTEKLVDLYRDLTEESNTGSHTGVFGARIVGTPGYMAPEQAKGAVAEFGPTTDVFGLGGVLYFLLYGKAPNQGRSMTDVIAASSEKKKTGTLRPGILPRGQRISKEAKAGLESLETICLKALEPRQSDRYPNVEAMIVELNEWLAHTPGPPLGF